MDTSLASAFVYWTSVPKSSIGRANLDGSGVAPRFIPGVRANGLAVDGAHLFWSIPPDNMFASTGRIERANLDGSGVNHGFITGINTSGGLAVDAAHVYWTSNPKGSLGSALLPPTIGRANLDGSGANQSFITVGPDSSGGFSAIKGVAVDGAHIYWSEGNSIGRANLDGSGVNDNFITGANGAGGVVVDGSHVYWTNAATSTLPERIGRANLDGSGANQSLITRGSPTTGLAVDARHIYWPELPGTIARANLDGSGVKYSFISAQGSFPLAVAVDGLGGTGRATVSSVRFTPTSFKAAGSGPSATADTVKTGTRVTFVLSASSRVRFSVERSAPGRRVGKRCVAPTSRNSHARHCTRVVTLGGSFTRAGAAGSNHFHFSGRVAGHRLAPGPYRLVVTPAGGTGKRASFRVKP